MGNKNVTRITAAGTELSDEEYTAIRREAIKDTVKNGLAAVGVLTVVVFVKAMFDNYNNPTNSDKE